MRSSTHGFGVFIRAALAALLITAYGQGLWGVLVVSNLRTTPHVPWAAPAMAVLLAALVAYLSGRGWPGSTASARRDLLRLNPVRGDLYRQALLAGALALVAFGGAWLTVSDLVALPKGLTPDMRDYPLATGLSFLVMSCLAAPVSEEAAFRGYAQGLLERAWGSAPAAILGSSLLFAAVHVTQGVFLPKLGLYFLAGLIFGAIAYLTNSLYASIPIHALGDVLGFLVLWPHDGHVHPMGPADPVFWPALAALVVGAPLSFVAFQRLAAMRTQTQATPPRPAWPAVTAP